MPAFELLTRKQCHLCEKMREVLDEVLPAFGLEYSQVDIDDVSDPVGGARSGDRADLRVRFGDSVPVLLRDGKPVAKVRIDREQLVRIVRRRREP